MSKKLVEIKQSKLGQPQFRMPEPSVLALIELPTVVAFHLADDFHAHMHNAGIVISTFKRVDGSLIHNTTQGQHDMCQKVPDYTLVGMGNWQYR